MKSFTPIAFVIALGSLIGLLWINISALSGKPAPFELSFTSVFFVLFPLWAFTIYYLRQTRPALDTGIVARMSILEKIRYFQGNIPNWAMILLAVFYAYALYSLFLFMTGGMMDPEYVNGQYQIQDHGNVTMFTEAEYQIRHQLYLRSVTGFFMAFFSVSTVVLAPWKDA